MFSVFPANTARLKVETWYVLNRIGLGVRGGGNLELWRRVSQQDCMCDLRDAANFFSKRPEQDLTVSRLGTNI